jgi:ribosome-binding protein aMBF1 (putative translation factor)
MRLIAMDEQKRKRLEKAGWKVGEAADFLELSPEEAEFVELKLALADELREQREKRGLTQEDVAREVGSSQSRVAKMEAADPTVSVDLLVRSLLKLGASRADVGRVVARRRRRSPF